MSDLDRLQDKLAKLGRPASVQRFAAAAPLKLLQGILTAVDESVLPREITLSGGQGTLVMQAAGRRLMSVQGAVEMSLSEDMSQDDLTALRDRILAACEGAGDLSLDSRRPAEAVEASDVGLSVAVLARAWEVSLYGERDLIGDLVGACGPDAAAILTWADGVETLRQGDEAALARICDHIDALRQAHRGDAPESGLRLRHSGSDTRVVVYAWDGGADMAALVDASAVDRLARCYSDG